MTEPLLLVLPLVSAVLWLAIGTWPFLRYRFASPFQQSLTAAALLLGGYALLDWLFFQTADPRLAIALADVRASAFTLAVFLVFLAAKWIYYGHSRYDPLLAVSAAISLAIVWGGLTRGVQMASWGPQLVRDPTLYVAWAGIHLALLVASAAITVALYRARRDLPSRLRVRISWSAASLGTVLVIWAATNVYISATQTGGIPWFSSLLFIPAAMLIVGFFGLSGEETGEVFRAASAVEQRVSALYVFYRTGEPLVALGASRSLPIEAEQLQGILDVVGNFVETSMRKFRGYAVTAMRFDRLGIVAVRGQHVIVAAVYEGPAYDALRSELLRSLQDFEARHAAELATWEGATGVAEEVGDELSVLLRRPTATGPRHASKQ